MYKDTNYAIWDIYILLDKHRRRYTKVNGRVVFLMPRQLALRKRSPEQQRKTISDEQQAHNIMRWYTKHKSTMLPDIHLILWYIWRTYFEKIVIVIANMLSTSRNQEGFQDHHLHPIMMLDDVRVRLQPPEPRVTSHSKTVLKTRRSPKKSNAY